MATKEKTRPKARELVPVPEPIQEPERLEFTPGTGALVVINRDPNAPVVVQCLGVTLSLQPGLAYPLPLKDITDLRDSTGTAWTHRDKKGRLQDGTKQLAWYYHATAQPIARGELERISQSRQSTLRGPMAVVKAAIDRAYGSLGKDDQSHFARIWAQGARERDEHGTLKGRAGAIAAIRAALEQVEEKDRPSVRWDAESLGLPEGAVPVDVDALAVVRHTGEIVSSFAEQQRQEHMHNTMRVVPPPENRPGARPQDMLVTEFHIGGGRVTEVTAAPEGLL